MKAPLVLVLLITFTKAQMPPGSSCRTPDVKPGVCILLKECEPLLRALIQRQKVINNMPATEFLRRSQCGFSGSSPVVCCATSSSTKTGVAGMSNFSGQHPNTRILPTECGHSVDDYIVGGSVTQLGEHPWLAGLEYNTRKGSLVACGGALINKRYVLTAAHCIGRVPNAQLIAVRLGEHDLSTEEDCEVSKTGKRCAPPVQRIPVETIVQHPQYKGASPDKHFDIGLVRLRKDADFNEFVRPVCLPISAQLEPRGGPLKGILTGSMGGSQQTVAGWGRTESSVRSDKKLRVTLPVLENAQCAALYKGRVKLAETQMCAGGQAGKDSCSGDSGGPLMTIQAEKWVVTGVVSVGPQNCGTANQPGVYTRVLPFMTWILDTMSP